MTKCKDCGEEHPDQGEIGRALEVLSNAMNEADVPAREGLIALHIMLVTGQIQTGIKVTGELVDLGNLPFGHKGMGVVN